MDREQAMARLWRDRKVRAGVDQVYLSMNWPFRKAGFMLSPYTAGEGRGAVYSTLYVAKALSSVRFGGVCPPSSRVCPGTHVLAGRVVSSGSGNGTMTLTMRFSSSCQRIPIKKQEETNDPGQRFYPGNWQKREAGSRVLLRTP
jgi:hypothetical protein